MKVGVEYVERPRKTMSHTVETAPEKHEVERHMTTKTQISPTFVIATDFVLALNHMGFPHAHTRNFKMKILKKALSLH